MLLTPIPPTPAGRKAKRPALSPAERREAEQVARRLHDELRDALLLLPPHLRGASALARHLRIDRATCQRIVGCTTHPDEGPMTLINLPGVQGLRLFLRALGEDGRGASGTETIAAAGAAVDRFEAYLRSLKVSQRGLRALLLRPAGAVPEHDPSLGQDDPAVREALFHAAHAALGRSTDTLLAVRIIKPVHNTPDRTESINVRGHLGHTARRGSMPLELGAFAASPSADKKGGAMFTTLDPPQESAPWGSMLAPFCSQPLPRIVTRHEGARILHAVEPAAGAHPHRAFDIVIANRTGLPEPHPAHLTPAIGEISTVVQFPARLLVMDVFLHRDIAERCTASLQTHLWTPAGGHVTARWSTRVPGGPPMGMPARGDTSQPWARHEELLAHVFAHAGWDRDEFRLYRCLVEWPMWRCAYHMLFDFEAKA